MPLLPAIPSRESLVDARAIERERRPARRVWRVVPTAMRPSPPAWLVGSIVHEALAAWRFPGHGSPAEEFAVWAQARAREYGIADSLQLRGAVDETARLLLRFRDHELYERMDRAEKRLHEVPYSISRDGRAENGVIDALFREDGRWTIVEFKTDAVGDRAALDTLLAEEDYVAQAARYVEATDSLLGQRPGHILCLLNYGGTVRLETDLLG